MLNINIGTKVAGAVMQCVIKVQSELNILPIVIEIGSAEAQGVLRYAGYCKKVIAIDTMVKGRPDVKSLEKEDMEIDQDKLLSFKKNVDHEGFDVRLVIGSSQWKESVDSVKNELGIDMSDILLIDGVHHPRSLVQMDFDLYSPFVKKGGYIIFDDSQEDDILAVCNEILKSKSYERVADNKPKCSGQYNMIIRKLA